MANRVFVVTTNEQKYNDYVSGFGHGYIVEKYNVHLNEIQSMDITTIVKDKLYSCRAHGFNFPTIVDDVSLELDDLNGFPGPFVKFMISSIGLAKMSRKFHGSYATFRVASAFANNYLTVCESVANFIECQIIDTPDANGGDFEQILFLPSMHRRFSDLSIKERQEIHPRFLNIKQIINFLNKQ